jgi:hypothetical protein
LDGQKGLPGSNTPAYLCGVSWTKKIKVLFNIDTRAQCNNTFFFSKLRTVVISWRVPGKPFQPSLMFTGKIGAYQSKASFICSTIGLTPDLYHNHKTSLKIPASDKHSSLLQKFLIYGRKKTFNIDTR